MASSFAPILVFVHTREKHFKNLINSLLTCKESESTELFISSDFYRNDHEKKSVESIRSYIDSIKGFKKINRIYFDKNVGVEFASQFSINKVLENHESIIISEDDNLVSPLFLLYMNKMLDYYNNNKSVFSISGFSSKILMRNYNYQKDELYASNICNVWGWGTWKDRYEKYIEFRNSDKLYETLKNDLKNKSFNNKLKKVSITMLNNIYLSMYDNNIPSFDYLIGYYCTKYDYLNINNSNTYVLNFGHDGSGLNNLKNTRISNRMQEVDFASGIPETIPSPELRNDYIYKYESSLMSIIKYFLIKLRIFKLLKFTYRKISN